MSASRKKPSLIRVLLLGLGLGLVSHNLLAASTPPAQAEVLGCLLTPKAEADIGSQVVGILARVAVERGDAVKKGQVLAQLQDDVERAALNAAQQRFDNAANIAATRSAYEYAQEKAKRYTELAAKEFLSPIALQQAEAEAKVAAMRYAEAQELRLVARKELAVAREQLALRTIVAPFAGVVVERYVQAGTRVEEKPILKIAQIDPLRVELVSPASRFGKVKIGSSAMVTPDLPGATPAKARVSGVDAVVDAASNTFRIRLELPNPGAQIPSGLRCQVSFEGAGG